VYCCKNLTTASTLATPAINSPLPSNTFDTTGVATSSACRIPVLCSYYEVIS
jgi:hypothetical protein